MSCLVTVRHQERAWDLELPTDLAARELVVLLLDALGLPAPRPGHPPLRLSLAPLGATLADDQDLAAAQVLDGAILVLSDAPVRAAQTGTDAIGDTPTSGWRPLAAEAPAEKKPGYTWKKLED